MSIQEVKGGTQPPPPGVNIINSIHCLDARNEAKLILELTWLHICVVAAGYEAGDGVKAPGLARARPLLGAVA